MQRLDFTREQREAIEHIKSHLRIIACPGSGKTEVVSRNVAFLIKNGTKPKNIVAFTFTDKAAEELKTRIRGILEEECPEKADVGDMFVGTIHSFCFFMLKEVEPAYKSYDVLDEAQRVAFVSKPSNFFTKIELIRLKKHYNLKHYETINRFLYSADIMMMEDIDPSRLKDERFAECYQAYRKVLDEEKYFDFSSIIHTLVELLRKDNEKRKLIQELVKYVILDEYQDVNKLQEKLLELLSDGAESVCVVGDDDQNLYHWRGSDVGIIAEFDKRYSKKFRTTDAHLDTNFRSTDAIVFTARSFIEHNSKRLSKNMVPNKDIKRKFEDGDIVHRHFDTEDDEFLFIANKIRELQGTDFLDKRNRPFSLTLRDFAVLARTNNDAARIIKFFEAKGILCIAYSGTSVFERPEVKLAMDCIGYVFDCQGYTVNNPQLGDLVSRYGNIFNRRMFPPADPRVFESRLKAVKVQAHKILAKSPKDYLPDLGLQGFYHKILNAMGAEDFNFGEVVNYNLAVLSQAISDYETVWIRLRASEVKGFFYFVFAYARSHYSEIQHSDPTLIDAVKVLTIHKAKGLEFPAVFIPCFLHRRKPNETKSFVDSGLYDSDRYYGDEEDERRMYYTAMTRSEKYLFITGAKQIPDRKKHYKPNPCLDEIDKKYFSDTLSVPKPRSGYPPKAKTAGTYPTSFSQLSCYRRCPEDFKLRYIFGYNAGVPVAFGYGANIHNILNVVHRGYISEKRIPTDAEIDRIFEIMFKLRYATAAISEPMKRAGMNIVKNYVKLHKHEFVRILETEKKFEFVIDDAFISGQIDLLKKVDEQGKVTDVEIIDFKTEKKDGAYEVDHERQLRYYAIACLNSLGLKPKRAYVHHLDTNKQDLVDISEEHLDKTKAEIKIHVNAVLNRDFPPDPRRNKCNNCDYERICPHKGFSVGIA